MTTPEQEAALNPLLNPKPGDVIRLKLVDLIRTVLDVNVMGIEVFDRDSENDEIGRYRRMDLGEFRDWAAGGEVIKRG